MPRPVRLALGAATAGLLGWGAFAWLSTTDVEGELRSEGGTLGSWTLRPDACESGDRRNARGVRLFRAGDPGRSVLVDDLPSGPQVQVTRPGTDRAVRLMPSACALHAAPLRMRGTPVNGARLVDGTLELDCAVAGGRLSGRVTFANCN